MPACFLRALFTATLCAHCTTLRIAAHIVNQCSERAAVQLASAHMARCSHCGTEGASKKCSNCKQAFYCSKDCQKAHFRIHKKECARLANGVPCLT